MFTYFLHFCCCLFIFCLFVSLLGCLFVLSDSQIVFFIGSGIPAPAGFPNVPAGVLMVILKSKSSSMRREREDLEFVHYYSDISLNINDKRTVKVFSLL